MKIRAKKVHLYLYFSVKVNHKRRGKKKIVRSRIATHIALPYSATCETEQRKLARSESDFRNGKTFEEDNCGKQILSVEQDA